MAKGPSAPATCVAPATDLGTLRHPGTRGESPVLAIAIVGPRRHPEFVSCSPRLPGAKEDRHEQRREDVQEALAVAEYPADDQGWVRPPHIHFRVAHPGYHELTTQMYFAGEPLNEPDLLRRQLPPDEHARLSVDFQPAGTLGPDARAGSFTLSLRRVV